MMPSSAIRIRRRTANSEHGTVRLKKEDPNQLIMRERNCYPGSTWTSIGTFARCCATSPGRPINCMIATACSNTSLLLGPNSEQIETCSGTGFQTICVEGSIVEKIGEALSVLNFDCWSSWSGGNWAATRTVTATAYSITSPATDPNTTWPTVTTLVEYRALLTGVGVGLVVTGVVLGGFLGLF